MIYRWVERCAALTPFGPDFSSVNEALDWGRDWKKDHSMTPEHAEIFLVHINEYTKEMGIYRAAANSPVTNLGWL